MQETLTRKYASAKIKKSIVNGTFNRQLVSKALFLEIASTSIITEFQITQMFLLT
jgi:hypothetical protein